MTAKTSYIEYKSSHKLNRTEKIGEKESIVSNYNVPKRKKVPMSDIYSSFFSTSIFLNNVKNIKKMPFPEAVPPQVAGRSLMRHHARPHGRSDIF